MLHRVFSCLFCVPKNSLESFLTDHYCQDLVATHYNKYFGEFLVKIINKLTFMCIIHIIVPNNKLWNIKISTKYSSNKCTQLWFFLCFLFSSFLPLGSLQLKKVTTFIVCSIARVWNTMWSRKNWRGNCEHLICSFWLEPSPIQIEQEET